MCTCTSVRLVFMCGRYYVVSAPWNSFPLFAARIVNTPFFLLRKIQTLHNARHAGQCTFCLFVLLRREAEGLDMSLCLSTGLRCWLKPYFSRRLVSRLHWLNWTAYFVLEGTRTLNLRLRRATPYPLGHKDFPFNIISVSPYDDNIATTNSIPGCTRRFLYKRKSRSCWAPSGIRIFLNAQNFLSQSPEILFFGDVCFHAL